MLEPELEHHENPDERPIVSGVRRKMLGEQGIGHFAAHDSTPLQRGERVTGEFAERRVCLQPYPDGKAKPMLFLGQDLRWQESTSAFFKK